jgi:hypothetical protein
MKKSVRWRRMSTFGAHCRPALIAVAGVTILLSGCSQGASQSGGAQDKQVTTQPQAQKDTIKQQQDTQAPLAPDAKKLKDGAKVVDAKTAAPSAAKAAPAAGVAKTTAAKSSSKASKVKAQPQEKQCEPGDEHHPILSAGPNTTCAFAHIVSDLYLESNTANAHFDAYSPTTRLTYTMMCTFGHPIVCRGGNNAVVYMR